MWAARYTAGLRGPSISPCPRAARLSPCVPSLRHRDRTPAKSDALLKFLNDSGVDAKTHYSIAIHQQAGYPWGKGARIAGPLANAESNAATCISLPMFPELTAQEVDYVIAKVLRMGQDSLAKECRSPELTP